MPNYATMQIMVTRKSNKSRKRTPKKFKPKMSIRRAKQVWFSTRVRGRPPKSVSEKRKIARGVLAKAKIPLKRTPKRKSIRKRGRPRKPKTLVTKRPRGRPRKTPKSTKPKRPRGRPRKHPKKTGPKRPRGRPRKSPKKTGPKRPRGRPRKLRDDDLYD